MGPQNDFPDLNHFRAAYAESVIAKETLEEQVKENEELKKLKEQMLVLQKGISSMKGAHEVTDMNAFSLYPEARLPPGFKLPPSPSLPRLLLPKPTSNHMLDRCKYQAVKSWSWRILSISH